MIHQLPDFRFIVALTGAAACWGIATVITKVLLGIGAASLVLTERLSLQQWFGAGAILLSVFAILHRQDRVAIDSSITS